MEKTQEEKIKDTIQNFLDNAKSELLDNNIIDIVPMAFLFSKFNSELIKKFAKDNDVEYKELFEMIIKDTFDMNLVTSLNIALGNLEEKNNER